MAIIQGEGYTFNTETRKIEFGEKVCWNCKGEGKVNRYPACVHYGKVVNRFPNRKCPMCGSKNKHSHGRKMINGKQVVEVHECHTCNGTGMEKTNLYSSLDFTPIQDQFVYELFVGKMTFNDQYLGLGNISGFGCQGYDKGRFATVEACVDYATGKTSSNSAFDYLQAGNLCNENGYVPEKIYIKTNGYGFTGMIIGAKFGR